MPGAQTGKLPWAPDEQVGIDITYEWDIVIWRAPASAVADPTWIYTWRSEKGRNDGKFIILFNQFCECKS